MSGESVTLKPSGFTFPRQFFDPRWEVKNASITVCDYRSLAFRPSQGVGYQTVGYQADGILVSYFVYDNGLSPQQIDEKAILDEMAGAVREIYAAKNQGVYSSVTPLDIMGKPVDSPPLLRMPVGDTPLFLCRFRLTMSDGLIVDSAVIMSAGRGAFLKCRLTSASGLPHGEALLGAAVKRMRDLLTAPN